MNNFYQIKLLKTHESIQLIKVLIFNLFYDDYDILFICQKYNK